MPEHIHTPIFVVSPDGWRDYELIDCGGFEKLERFGKYVLIRPETQAIWDKSLSDSEWRRRAHARYVGTGVNSGHWEQYRPIESPWTLRYLVGGQSLEFNLELTRFKHVGVFPEQAVNWTYIVSALKTMPVDRPKFLNLFAYTGGSSLAACAAGADVTHVDSIKQVVSWSRSNMERSGLDGIRWVVEDALKFAEREVKRGNRYHGIILDPPAFGHGPKGESWKLEKQISRLMQAVFALLDREHSFLILNTYSLGFSSQLIGNLTAQICAAQQLEGAHWLGELSLASTTGFLLPLGVLYRFEMGR
jgi:23S rRNA (cytosine1962-C5)-methyltransferase